MDKVLIIGANGTIGSALQQLYRDKGYEVHIMSRNKFDYSSNNLSKHADDLAKMGRFSVIISTIGVLHDDVVSPEKSLGSIQAEKLIHYYHVNAVLPMLCIKAFTPLLKKNEKSVFICLSAMVGSTTDNRLGGWYGYRSSKAALNSLIKTTAIELKRSNKHAVIAAIHPGTTIGNLSAPFAKNINPKKYYSPDVTASRIADVIDRLAPEQSGQFFNWDGSVLPW